MMMNASGIQKAKPSKVVMLAWVMSAAVVLSTPANSALVAKTMK